MTKKELVMQIRNLLDRSDILGALNLLFSYVEGKDRDLETTISIRKAQYHRLQRQNRNGTIDPRDYNRGMAQIQGVVEEVLDLVPTENDRYDGGNPSNSKIKILFLTANPKATSRLSLEREIRKVKDALRAASLHDKFEFHHEPAVRVQDITLALMQIKPDIVHFSGHGSGEKGLIIESDGGRPIKFPTTGLKNLFRLFKNDVSCVVLNACYASEQAVAISRAGKDSDNKSKGIYAVGMNEKIGDRAAIDFSTGFYQAIGEGNDYQFAFAMAMIHISVNLEDADKPELWFNGGKIS